MQSRAKALSSSPLYSISGVTQVTMQSGITVSEGTELFDGMANINGTINGGSSVSLSNYTSSGGGPGGW